MRIKMVCMAALMALVLASGVSVASEAASPSEGIGVHGAWTIEVYNPDGSLDERVQFHNEFVGAGVLADLLSLADTMTGWKISATASLPICDYGNGTCAFPATSRRDIANDELVVEGSFSPDFDGEVIRVVANIETTSAGNKTFSNKALDVAIAVGAGQTVQVEVRYTFAPPL